MYGLQSYLSTVRILLQCYALDAMQLAASQVLWPEMATFELLTPCVCEVDFRVALRCNLQLS